MKLSIKGPKILHRSHLFVVAIAVASLAFSRPLFACDICAIYTSSSMAAHEKGSYTIAISEQLTSFDRAESEPENSIRDGELVRSFSTTQFAFAYDVSEVFGLQVNLPMIGRRFDRIEGYRAETMDDLGLGDMAVLGSYSVMNDQEADWTNLASVTIGIKLPTGDTGVLEDVSEEGARDGESLASLKHHTVAVNSGVGGRVLTFGSGSVDFIFGANSFLRYQKMILLTQVQYTLRTEGDYDYEFADDFVFTTGPGVFLYNQHPYNFAVRAALSGEFKGKDNFAGEVVQGSQVSNLYLGPETILIWDDRVNATLGLDFRVTGEDTDATVVPETRLRLSMAYSF